MSAAFGELLRFYREQAGLTQQELAERAGLSPSTVSSLERGERRRPYLHTVRRLTDALDLSKTEQKKLHEARKGNAQPAPQDRPVSTVEGWLEPPTPLIGREQDIQKVVTLLGTRTARLVTLTGPGGVGKTRLGGQVATLLTAYFVDGVVFVNLASTQDAHWVVYTIATALGLQVAQDQSVPDLVRSYLRSREMLLVLDNFEHLLEAAADVVTLLLSCSRVSLLVTSRTALAVRGEQIYPVAPLALPPLPGVGRPEEISEAAAVRLFVQCAQAAWPTFALTEENLPEVAAICRRLDGLPLALELAAARTRLLSPAVLRSRLERILPLLSAGARDLPKRQQTMAQTFAWSYGLLSLEEQQLFRRLAVFAGGWTLSAAEAVCRDGTTAEGLLDLLGSLHDKSLLVRLSDTSGEPRFTLLETIRAYALEQLEAAGEAEKARRSHAAYFLALAEETAPRLKGPEQAEWLDRLTLEHDNLRAALDWYLGEGCGASILRIGWALWRYWHIRVHVSEGLQWFEPGLALSSRLPLSLQMQGQFVVGILLYQQGRFAATVELLSENLAVVDSVDLETQAYFLLLYGFALIGLSRPQEAAPALRASLAAAQRTGNQVEVGIALTGLAQVALLEEKFDEAAALLAEGECLLRAGGSDWDLGLNLSTAATLVLNQGHPARAAQLFLECLSLIVEMRPSSAVFPLEGLAQSLAVLGHAEPAARLMGAAEAWRERTGTRAYASEKARQAHNVSTSLLRDRLGEERLQALWQQGRNMPLTQLLEQLPVLDQRYLIS